MRKTKARQNIAKEKVLCFILHSDSIVLSLDVDGILHHKSFGNVSGLCLAVEDKVYQKQSLHTVAVIEYNVLLVLLILLSISSYKSFQDFLKSTCSSFLIAQLYSITFIHHNLFSHSPIDGHPLDFQFLATTKRTAINIFKQVGSLPNFMISLGYRHRSGIYESKGMYNFISFWA